MIKLAIVSPCYNEEDILEISASVLLRVMESLRNKGKISRDSFIVFVNDGSKDSTWSIISRLHSDNPVVKGINLARNVGHQNALMAGMMTVTDICDAAITIDCDLQDDVEAIEKMVDRYQEGFDIVYGVKVSREGDSFLKRLSAQAFYRLQKGYAHIETIYNHADFRLLSKRVLRALSQYHESNLYLRGIIPMIGFSSTTVDDVISKRKAGKSKYSMSKMLNLALDGITSFTAKPMMSIIHIGLIFTLVSLFLVAYVLIKFFSGDVVQGWSSLMISIWFVGGVLLISLGVIGIYVGRVFTEVKHRPLYTISDTLL